MITKLHTKSFGGFTLIEVVLYLAILSTLVFSLSSCVSLISNARVKNQTMAEVGGQALQIVQVLNRIIHDAQSVTTPTVGDEQQSLSLVDSDDNPVTVTLTDGSITINRGSGAESLHNDRITASNVEFKNLSRPGTPDIIQINFTLSYKNDFSNSIYDYSKTYVSAVRLYK